jgi:hypothetical protein
MWDYDLPSPQSVSYADYPYGQHGTDGSSIHGSGRQQSNFEMVGDYPDNRNKRRRGNLPKAVTDILRSWFYDHISHPYPSEDEKQILMARTGLSISQVSPAAFPSASLDRWANVHLDQQLVHQRQTPSIAWYLELGQSGNWCQTISSHTACIALGNVSTDHYPPRQVRLLSMEMICFWDCGSTTWNENNIPERDGSD